MLKFKIKKKKKKYYEFYNPNFLQPEAAAVKMSDSRIIKMGSRKRIISIRCNS